VATVTLVYGEIGAGKTSYARTLEARGAVRLSLDEWTIAASGERVHVDMGVVDRVLDQLMLVWPSIAKAGADVVLDLAFWDRSRRDEARRSAASVGARVALVHVVCDAAERRSRVIDRSVSDADSFLIDGSGFDWITRQRRVDPLGPDEPHVVVDTSSATVASGAAVLAAARGLTDLDEMLRTLEPTARPGEYVYAVVDATTAAALQPNAMVVEDEGVTVVLARDVADAAGLAYEFVAAWITLTVQSSLAAVGLTAAFATALAREGISCNVLAGAHHDHLLVPYAQRSAAVAALRALSETSAD